MGMRKRLCLKISCCFLFLALGGCDVLTNSKTSEAPFQPYNPYFYNLQRPFDMLRAWIDVFLGPLSE